MFISRVLVVSGSKRKRAAITGASYLITATTPLTRDNGGRVALTVAGPTRTAELILIDPSTGAVEVLRRSFDTELDRR